MADTVFRNKQEEVKSEPVIAKEGPTPSMVNDVPTPYLDTPAFLDDYFKLGTEWQDQDASLYPELDKIDGYIKAKIKDGEIPNDQKAVADFIKGLEKVNNLKSESRSVVKLEVLANYVEFLMKNDHLKSNLRRYNHV